MTPLLVPITGCCWQGSLCCAYGAAGADTKYDCVMIPGASNGIGVMRPPSICGRLLVTAAGMAAATVCCKKFCVVAGVLGQTAIFIDRTKTARNAIEKLIQLTHNYFAVLTFTGL